MFEILVLSWLGSRFWSPGIGRGVGVVRSTNPHLLPTLLGNVAMLHLNSTEPLGFTEPEEEEKVVMQELLIVELSPLGVEHTPFLITPWEVWLQTLVRVQERTHWFLSKVYP